MQHARTALAIAACLTSTACATMLGAGKQRSVQDTTTGHYTKVAMVRLSGTPTIGYAAKEVDGVKVPVGFRIYEGDRLLPILEEGEASFAPGMLRMCRDLEESEKLGIGGAKAVRKYRDAVAKVAASSRHEHVGDITSYLDIFPAGCDKDYIWFPYVELDKSVPHELRLISRSRETTITVKPTLHFRWIWLNGFLAAGAPIGWAIDAATGSWTYFNTVDVRDALQHGQKVAASSGGR